MSSLEVLVVDDERLSRRRLKRLLQHDAEVRSVAECDTALSALDYLSKNRVDLVFLDIQMPGMDGFRLLEAAGAERTWCAIFVTAYDQFALRAFDVHALDYLLKPFSDERLSESLRRAKSFLKRTPPSAAHEEARFPQEARPGNLRDRLVVKVGESLVLLRTDQVDWIEAADNYVYLHCANETHIVRQTMNGLQKILDPRKFLRIHRSAIVNLDRVKALQPWFRGDYRVVL